MDDGSGGEKPLVNTHRHDTSCNVCENNNARHLFGYKFTPPRLRRHNAIIYIDDIHLETLINEVLSLEVANLDITEICSDYFNRIRMFSHDDLGDDISSKELWISSILDSRKEALAAITTFITYSGVISPLEHMPNLTYLSINRVCNEDDIYMTDERCSAMIAAINPCRNITTIDLSSCGLNAENIKKTIESLSENKSIKQINFSRNNLSLDEAEEISKWALKELHLSFRIVLVKDDFHSDPHICPKIKTVQDRLNFAFHQVNKAEVLRREVRDEFVRSGVSTIRFSMGDKPYEIPKEVFVESILPCIRRSSTLSSLVQYIKQENKELAEVEEKEKRGKKRKRDER